MNNEEQYANLELGKTYNFMGYKWTACELINNGKTLLIQSHGVTTGPWPGFKMSQFGNGHYYGSDIDGQDISSYDDKTQKLYDAIKDVEDMSATYGKGLYLVSAKKVQLPTIIYGASGDGYYCDAIVFAGSQDNPNGTHCNAWLGTLGNKENTAWFVNCFANGYIALQDDAVKTIAPAFNLDLSKVEIKGDEIIKKEQPAPSSFEHDDNSQEHQLLGKTYKFAGYNWIPCELINNGKTLVIQSHVVTRGAWPGLVISQFGNGNYYSQSIDGQDISGYDNKLKELYNAIKDAEDSSASYGKGLFLISKEKVGFTEFGEPGSGNYWAALKAVAENASQLGPGNDFVWLGTVDGGAHACCLLSSGSIHGHESGCNQNLYYVIAPAFNLDLSKVEIKGDEIIKKSKFDFASMAVATPSDNNLSANSNCTSMSAADAKNLFKDFAERLPSDKFYEMSQNNSSIQPDDSSVENRKAQFIIAEQGIAELAGAVTAQSDSSKELTDSSQYRSIWEYGMDLTKDGETFHLDPEMVSQIYEAITEDNGRNYVATYTSRKFTREQYIAICDEVENLLTNDSVEYRACENVLGVGFDNYTGQPASDNLPKKLDL